MSLLWKNAAAFNFPDPLQAEGMAWMVQRPGDEHYAQSAKPVKEAGFAGYVGPESDDDDYDEDHDDDHGGFDEDLYDAVRPDPTSSQERHYEEHGEYPQSHYDAHDEAYGDAMDKKQQDEHQANTPDWTNRHLHNFIREHGTNTHHWQQHATYGAVDLTNPVYATQSHVSQAHIDKYHHDPGATSHHQEMYGHHGGTDYLGDGAPMFVTHQGDLHTTEGHHRTAAALQRGDKSIMGWHYDADKHGFPDEEGRMAGDEDYEDPEDW